MTGFHPYNKIQAPGKSMKENAESFRKVVRKAISGGADFGDLFHEKREDCRITVATASDLVTSFGYTEGTALRLIKDGSSRSVHLELPDEGELMLAAEMLRAEAYPGTHDVAQRQDFKKGPAGGEKRKNRKRSGHGFDASLQYASPVREIALEAESLLKKIVREAFAYSISASFYRQMVGIMNIEEEYVEDTREAALFKIEVSEGTGQDHVSFDLSYGFPSAERMVQDLRTEDVKSHLIRAYMKRRNAVSVPKGDVALVLAPGSGGVFFHEAVGHVFEADSPLLKRFWAESQNFHMGASLSVYDDPAAMERGGYIFDDEGVKGRKKAIIEDGRFVNFLDNVLTARKTGKIPLGNGRRKSFRDIPLPRLSAIFIGPGEDDPESIVKSTEKGLYASRFGSAFLDESSGDFYINLTEGNIIDRGKMGPSIREVVIKGNAFKIFRSIDRIGNDLSFDKTGLVCSKSGQALPSSVGAPTMRVASILVFPE